MPDLSQGQRAMVRDLLARADRRLQGAAVAAARPTADPGEFDNNFDGVVSAIFHIVDAYELGTTGSKRQLGEADQPTRIHAVLARLQSVGVPNVPPAARLIDLNRRRNTSVHGEWMEVLDQDSLDRAIASARELLVAVRLGLSSAGINGI